MRARWDVEAARAIAREVGGKGWNRQEKVDWDSFGGTPRWGYKAVASKNEIPDV